MDEQTFAVMVQKLKGYLRDGGDPMGLYDMMGGMMGEMAPDMSDDDKQKMLDAMKVMLSQTNGATIPELPPEEQDFAHRSLQGKIEYRAVELRATITEPEEGQPAVKTLQGRAIVFDTPTSIYKDSDGTTYYEQIHHDALNGVDLSNVVLKYNHSEHVPPLASTRAGSMSLSVDTQGLNVIARMANTSQASDIHELVRTGNLDKMSFAFTVGSDDYDTKTKTRTIYKFDKIYDVSVVDFPAYEATSVSARSYVKAQEELVKKELRRREEEVAKKQRDATLAERRRQLLLKSLL
jgi:HK97 family phage prohead protease